MLARRNLCNSIRYQHAESSRFLFVDGMRGLAALSVVVFHLAHDFLGIRFADYLGQGVTVFFVLSGFVIAHSLVGKRIDGRFALNFAVKRSVRLDPAYWVTIVLAMAFVWVPGSLLGYDVVLPSLFSIGAHLLYLQDLAEIEPINGVFWSLCYEIQFYLVFLLVLVCMGRFNSERLGGRVNELFFAACLAFSLLWPLGVVSQLHPGLFVNLWFLFLLGSFARWAVDSPISRFVLAVAAIVLVLKACAGGALELFVGASSAMILFAATVLGKMGSWLSWRWLQYLGAISYSLYLVHDIAGLYVRDTGTYLSAKYFGWASLSAQYFWFAAGLAVSVMLAHLMWRFVEAPSHRLSRSLDVSRSWAAFCKRFASLGTKGRFF